MSKEDRKGQDLNLITVEELMEILKKLDPKQQLWDVDLHVHESKSEISIDEYDGMLRIIG